ncbi:MAG: glycosyltransferase [Anaerolineales bacterium]|nr:glycosyltransferase [Anaerolineales bacterium]
MRIAILASGSRGDVQPYIALGQGLQQSGHQVRFATHLDFSDLVRGAGLEFWPVEGNVANIAQSPEMRARLQGGNFISIMSLMAKEAQRGAISLAEGGLAAAQDSDLIIGGLGGAYTGLALAEKFNIPLVQAYYFPFTPTSAFPSVMLPGNPPGLAGAANRLSHYLTRQVMWQSFRKADRIARREVLDLPPAPFFGPHHRARFNEYPVLYAFSPHVIPPPEDWGPSAQITGYWFLEEAEGWTPAPELAQFIQAGDPPVYIGFGSMANRDPEETASLVLDALEETGQRAVLLTGWGGMSARNLPESVLLIDASPHSWLFPRMAAVIHHGGAGTTAAGLRAGVPNVVVPYFGDQPFWGKRIADLGVGPTPIPRKDLTAAALAEAIQCALTNAKMRESASQLGEAIRAEDGVGKAVAIINDSIGG